MSDRPFAGRRFYFVGIGGAGLSAYANFARAWGAEVRGWDVRETIFLEALDGIEVDVGGEPADAPWLRGDRLDRPCGSRGGTASRGVPRGAGCATPLDRRRRRARQVHDGRDDRVRSARARSGSGVDRRRRRPATRWQRGRRGGLARRRGRRVGPLDRPPRAGDRRRDERRARSSRLVRVRSGARRVLRRVAGASAVDGTRLGARARRPRACDPGRAQPAQCRNGSRSARARGRRARRGRARPRRLHWRRDGGSSSSASAEA